MHVDFLNLKRQYLKNCKEIEMAVVECLRSGAYIEGPKVKELEENMRKYLGVSHVITCGNGTEALVLALKACNIGEGDEVITSPFSFFATSEAIASVGAIPVFVDVKIDTYNIDPDKIEEKITEKTKAILPVHIFGEAADMDPINEIAQKHNLYVIEDSAQAIGCTYKGRKIGGLGTVGCFSFYPTKNLGACGDGGMVTTNNDEIANAVRALKAHGAGKCGARAFEYLNNVSVNDESTEFLNNRSELYDPYKYYNYLIGGNSRLDSIQAAVLLVKLKYLDEYTDRRRQIANRYNEELKNLPIQLPNCKNEGECWHQYAIMVPNKEELVNYLTSKDIGTGAFYPVPLHLQKAFGYLKYKEGDLKNAEYLCKHSVCLPIFPELEDEEQTYIIEQIQKFFRR